MEEKEIPAWLMQALHDPENQPSQFGTVPVARLEAQMSSLLRASNSIRKTIRNLLRLGANPRSRGIARLRNADAFINRAMEPDA